MKGKFPIIFLPLGNPNIYPLLVDFLYRNCDHPSLVDCITIVGNVIKVSQYIHYPNNVGKILSFARWHGLCDDRGLPYNDLDEIKNLVLDKSLWKEELLFYLL